MTEKEKEGFIEAVYEIVKTIPAGRATSYGAIARASGYFNLSRMVGKVMSECDSKRTGVPAHRVVNSQGILSGHEAFGGDTMQKLLEAEGIIVVNNKIKNWSKVFWDPMEEIAFTSSSSGIHRE